MLVAQQKARILKFGTQPGFQIRYQDLSVQST